MTDAREDTRTEPFRRNDSLEQFLALVNLALAPAEQRWLEEKGNVQGLHPLVFIMGPLRSGTTLLLQWLASTGIVAYPTNLLSRFYGAPALGGMIQLLLTDERYNFRNEILDFHKPIDFISENGKTVGALAPNEFWYFWRRFLPFKELDWLPDEELFRRVDTNTLASELNALTRIFNKPFAMKGMILNYNIPFLDRIFENALFIQIHREPVANIASVLEARKQQHGDEAVWYSFKIPEYPELEGLDALHQSAGQIACINRAVSRGISQVDESRKLFVDYDEFCNNPARIYEALLKKFKMPSESNPYKGAIRFEKNRQIDRDTARKIENALEKFQSFR
jgi:Sulfotransferase family